MIAALALLPFTKDQFFAVFAAYNTAVWPAQFGLLALAIALVAAIAAKHRHAGRLAGFGLALLWAWTALAYHLAFFRDINPAAPWFAAIALAAALAFALVGGVQGRLQFLPRHGARALPGWAMVAYAIVGYPAAGALAGHAFPAMPTFGLPCPTTLFTFGVLLLATPAPPRLLVLGPLLWALVGGSAAALLDVPQDYALFVAAAIGVLLLLPAGRRPAQ